MYNLEVSKASQRKIREILKYLDTEGDGLSKRFLRDFEDRGRFIQKNPDVFAIRYDDIRTIRLQVFSYTIHYKVLKNDKSVLISNIFHTSENPEKWKK
jgi:plasmid stabilization system protein ParE